MLATVAELITDVRSLINESADGFWLDTEITRWLNQGQEEICAATKVLSKYYDYTILADDIIDDREIRLPSDFITLDEGGVFYNDEFIDEITLTELNRYYGVDWRSETGTPIRFYRRTDNLGFFPKLSAGDTVKFYGVERAPTLVDAVAPFSGDYRTIPLRRYIRDYAIAQCWYKKRNTADYLLKMREVEKGIIYINNVVYGEKNQPRKMIPDERNRGGYINTDPLNM